MAERSDRSVDEAWGTGLGQDVLDGFCLFGPRDDDQCEPGPSGPA